MRKLSTFGWPAPSLGWRTSGNLHNAPLDAAERLDNIRPTSQGGSVRRGCQKHATVGAEAVRFMTYVRGDNAEMFCATSSAIYPVGSPADPDVAPTATRTSQSNGNWSSVQFSNAGGTYMIAANGEDAPWQYNGTTDTDLSITGVTAADLSQVWLWGNRLWFVESGSSSAWYLGVDAIGGAATELDLGSVFKKGGNLLFGANWSIDSGDGLGDKNVFVTDQGEVAVYGGTDPASSSTFQLEGVYQIAEPVDKFSHFQLGGELMILTGDGIIPLSQAVSRSYDELFQVAMTEPIEDDWKRAIARRSSSDPVSFTHWPTESLLYVTTPRKEGGLAVQYVCNTRYNTWCRYVGWDMKCGAVFNDRFYFGDGSGNIYQGEIGGTDNGTAYTANWVPKFSTLGTPRDKVIVDIGLVARSPKPLTFSVKTLTEYTEADLPVPATTEAPGGSSTWGTAQWGADYGAKWGGEDKKVGSRTWKSAPGVGYAISPAISITVNQTPAPNIDVVAALARFELGTDR